MKNRFINATHVEGLLYDHDLQMRESGPNSKNPGTQYIMGTVKVATDDNVTNVIDVHYTYVTATTSKGSADSRFETLKNIIDGKTKTVMSDGAGNAARIRIDSNVAVNDFYSNRDGNLVSAKRNEGGFIHLNGPWKENEDDRNTFDLDVVITNVRLVEADEERNLPEKAVVKCATFDFRKALIPLELSVTNPAAISYFMAMNASDSNPVCTEVRGHQVSTTVTTKITEESAFGEPIVREVSSSRKDWVISWARVEPYVWDDESFLTAQEFQDIISARATYLATVKQRQEEYEASRNTSTTTTTATTNVNTKAGTFKF